jgi:V/A-type H+-transporting ATPase subunit C
MALLIASDLDYLTARLHGRRSRLAETERLDDLCRLRTLTELGAAIIPGENFATAADLQRRFVTGVVGELSELSTQLTGPQARFLGWLLVRFQVENIKVILRGLLAKSTADETRRHLLPLPRDIEIDTDELLAAASLETFADLLPYEPLRESLTEAIVSHRNECRPFLFEAALDRGYFRELLVRVQGISGEDRDLIDPLIRQEIDTFHLMLIVRGRFTHDLKPEILLPFRVEGSAIPRGLFSIMLGDSDLQAVAMRAVGRVIDLSPATPDAAILESLAWHRFLRLANRAFRRSHMGFAAVIGYVSIRRIETANLITLSEGIRLGLAGDAIRARLIPRHDLEAAHV